MIADVSYLDTPLKTPLQEYFVFFRRAGQYINVNNLGKCD